jgi:hypothetical protein
MLAGLDSRNFAAPIREILAGIAARAIGAPIARVLTQPGPEAPPIRPERHVENSIATIKKRLTVALAKSLARCPCCQSTPRPPEHRFPLNSPERAWRILGAIEDET